MATNRSGRGCRLVRERSLSRRPIGGTTEQIHASAKSARLCGHLHCRFRPDNGCLAGHRQYRYAFQQSPRYGQRSWAEISFRRTPARLRGRRPKRLKRRRRSSKPTERSPAGATDESQNLRAQTPPKGPANAQETRHRKNSAKRFGKVCDFAERRSLRHCRQRHLDAKSATATTAATPSAT